MTFKNLIGFDKNKRLGQKKDTLAVNRDMKRALKNYK